jgi:hypothetical protein
MTAEELKRIEAIETRLKAIENLSARLAKAIEAEGGRIPSDPEELKLRIQAASKAYLGR